MSPAIEILAGCWNLISGRVKVLFSLLQRSEVLCRAGQEQIARGESQLAWGHERVKQRRTVRAVRDEVARKLNGL